MKDAAETAAITAMRVGTMTMFVPMLRAITGATLYLLTMSARNLRKKNEY